jgi:hypothetical protein
MILACVAALAADGMKAASPVKVVATIIFFRVADFALPPISDAAVSSIHPAARGHCGRNAIVAGEPANPVIRVNSTAGEVPLDDEKLVAGQCIPSC